MQSKGLVTCVRTRPTGNINELGRHSESDAFSLEKENTGVASCAERGEEEGKHALSAAYM